MRKPLSGKSLFEAMGRRAYTKGLPLNYKRAMHHQWPLWAQCAWMRGWLYQQPSQELTESIVKSFESEAKATGRTLQKIVTTVLDSQRQSEEENPAKCKGDVWTPDMIEKMEHLADALPQIKWAPLSKT